MKKKLETELMSLAHKILKLKNKSELRVLHNEAKIVYEKLSVLLFLEEHLPNLKADGSFSALENQVITVFENIENAEPKIVAESKPLVKEVIAEIPKEIQPKIEEEIIPVKIEKIEEIKNEEIKEETITLNFSFQEEEIVEIPKIAEVVEEEIVIPEPIVEVPVFAAAVKPSAQVSLEEILEDIKPTPTFVKASEPDHEHHKAVSVNDRLKKTVTIGLNDKIAFVKYLFAGNDADFIRVISQLNTFANYTEAKNFIKNIVKPDYKNWVGKEEMEERFMHIIENKFS